MNYSADRASDLAKEIDRLIASGEPITESVGEALAAQFLPEARLNGDIMEAGDALNKELLSVTKAIENAQRSSEVYGAQLATASASLESQDEGQVRDVIETLTAATRKVQDENRAWKKSWQTPTPN